VAFGPSGTATAAEPAARMLAHDVYFTLKDRSPEAKTRLVAGCKKYLADHPGTVWFAAGALVEEHQREVNDRGFDVALHIVFKDKASHDKYQDADGHHKFIEEYQDCWETVRVFDSWLDASSHGEIGVEADRPDQAKRLPLPDPACCFAGMIRGKVVAKYDGRLVVSVEKVPRVWKTSKAQDPEALVGKKVVVRGSEEEGRYSRLVARFLADVKPGETLTLDVAHKGQGEALTILELTEDQRERLSEK
jgi:hypothetical protein